MGKFILAFLLVMHGVIHLGYLTPAPTTDPNYPFRLNQSWLISGLSLGEPLVRVLGIALSLVTITGFLLAGLAAAGLLVSPQWGLPVTVAASVASLLLLLFFWHPWIILGVIIDLALIAGLLWLNWQPFGTLST